MTATLAADVAQRVPLSRPVKGPWPTSEILTVASRAHVTL
jgi:hypothetical protein